MAFVHGKCVRCGYLRPTQEQAGLPTCDVCLAKLRDSHEPVRKCPADGSVMDKLFRGNILIDRCPRCAGVWLDADELKAIETALRQQEQHENRMEFWEGFLWGSIIS